MLKATFTSLAVFLYFGLAGQSRAFFLNENGLLLQDTAVACLCSTVDSLNQAFETSDPEPNLQSAPQARGHYIEFRTTPPNALADMKAGVDFEQFIKRHSPQKVDRDVIIQKSYAWLNNTAVTQFTYLPYNQNFGNRLTWNEDERQDDEIQKGRYFWNIQGSYLKAFFFVENFETGEIPPLYDKMIRYARYLNTPVPQYSIGTSPPRKAYQSLDTSYHAWHAFRNNLKKLPMPAFPKRPYLGKSVSSDPFIQIAKTMTKILTLKEIYQLDITRINNIKEACNQSPELRNLLQEAVESALQTGVSDEELEYYAGELLEPKIALKIMKMQRLSWYCGNDDGPIIRYLREAVLAGRACQWGPFLRDYLKTIGTGFDIYFIFDKFIVIQKQGRVLELEEVGLDIPAFFIGMMLIANDKYDEIYLDSKSMYMKVLPESRYSSIIEYYLLHMVADPTLDRLNRLMTARVFQIYCENHPDKARSDQLRRQLDKAIQTMPDYMARQIAIGNKTDGQSLLRNAKR